VVAAVHLFHDSEAAGGCVAFGWQRHLGGGGARAEQCQTREGKNDFP